VQHPLDHLLRIDAETAAWLDGRAEAWTTRTFFSARVVHGRDAMRVRVIGFDPARDEAVFPRGGWRLAGEVPETAADGLLISVGLARIFGVEPGDRLIVEARTMEGAMNALDLPIAGVVRAGNPAFDRVGVMVPADLALDLVRTKGAFSHLAVRLGDRAASDEVAAGLRGRVSGARVTTWREESQDLLDLQDLRQTMLDIIAFALMAIAATGIANTVLMAAYERVREIGTLRAMGLTRGAVVGLFVTEGAVMGTVGSLLGAALGGFVVHRYSVDGIDLSSMIESAGSTGAYESIPISVMLYMESSGAAVAIAAAVGLGVALLASVYPALIASRMTPAEAVRAE
jgi:putative ABC transport system permease protein